MKSRDYLFYKVGGWKKKISLKYKITIIGRVITYKRENIMKLLPVINDFLYMRH